MSMSILYFILVLFVIVVVHEWGHYKMARFFNIRVDEFGFGYPPKIKTLFTYKGTPFTLNVLPFGGFVKIFGEDQLETSSIDINHALYSKPKWQQALVLSAGVFMNVVLAWFLFFILFIQNASVISSFIPQKYITNTHLVVTGIVEKSSAEQAGIKKGDYIESGYNEKGDALDTSRPEFFSQFIQKSKSERVYLSLKDKETHVEKKVILTPVFDVASQNFKAGLGLSLNGQVSLPWYKSFLYSFRATGMLLGSIFEGLFNLVKGIFIQTETSVEVSGPIGIIKTVGDASTHGITYVLFFTALISLNLAVLNILPIPALDGGRLFFLLIEKIKGRPLNSKIIGMIHSVSFFLLIGLMLVVTFFDIFKLFSK